MVPSGFCAPVRAGETRSTRDATSIATAATATVEARLPGQRFVPIKTMVLSLLNTSSVYSYGIKGGELLMHMYDLSKKIGLFFKVCGLFGRQKGKMTHRCQEPMCHFWCSNGVAFRLLFARLTVERLTRRYAAISFKV